MLPLTIKIATLDQLEAQKDTLGIGTIKKDATADITKTNRQYAVQNLL
ncbi:MAG: hypothetical protein ACLVAT_05230 [Lachnospiraceae bacterium]